MHPRRKRLKEAQTVAVSCDRLRPGPHGKEGATVRVRQRLCNRPEIGAFSFVSTRVARTCGGCGARCGAVRFPAASTDSKSAPLWPDTPTPTRPRESNVALAARAEQRVRARRSAG